MQLAKNLNNFSGNFNDKIILDLPLNINPKFSESLRTVLVEQTSDNWLFWFALLEEYSREKQDCLVPKLYKTNEGYKLGSWVENQRAKRTILNKNKISMLENLPNWYWNKFDADWDKGIFELDLYIKEFGDPLPPDKYISKSGFVRAWVRNRRNDFNKGKLSKEKNQ